MQLSYLNIPKVAAGIVCKMTGLDRDDFACHVGSGSGIAARHHAAGALSSALCAIFTCEETLKVRLKDVYSE